MNPRPGHVRALQIGFLVLLATCFAQAAYWIIDQVLHTAEVRDRLEGHYETDSSAARWMLAEGAPAEDVQRLFPHLVLSAGPSGVQVEQGFVQALERERAKRLNRYGWEGGFFLAVLLGSMGVIAHALRQSAELVKRQQNFLAAVSHEFKSPLASLRLSAETLELRELDRTATRRIAERMVAEVDRLEVMVTDILDAARLGEGRVAPEPMRLVLADEAARVVGHLACRARPARVELSADVPENLEVWADPAALRAVLSNLVRNAIHSVAASGGGNVRLTARAEANAVVIEVTDDGTGFEPAEAAKLFEKFYRPGDELRRRTPGTGLGLFIVENFVRLAGGSVEAASPGPGLGARFTVHWPAPPREERAA